jgi:very-short-patch-repair endonuclease
MGPYIADFACLEVGLVIEVDGGQHDGSSTDGRHDAFMRGKGLKVLRFWNNEVMANLEGVCSVILRSLPERCPHPSLPSSAHPSGAASGEGAEPEG